VRGAFEEVVARPMAFMAARRWPDEVRDMSRGDRGFALFLMVMLVVISALFYELFPRHGEQGPMGPMGEGASAPASNLSPAPAQK
jgi:hypothetical protein